MFNERSIQACNAATFGVFQKPLYDSYSFSRIPSTIQKLLFANAEKPLPQDTYNAGPYDTVVLFLLDSFGWSAFEKFSSSSAFLQRFVDRGIVSKITSQFPSTTTNHVTCMHTGLDVGQSGLYEWFIYEPLVDAAICPLHFSFAKDHGLNTLTRAGFRAKELFSFRTFYQILQEQGASSFVFQHKESANSPYSQALLEGAHVIGYKNLPEGLTRLGQELERATGKNYFFFYFGDIDGKGHEFGPDSPQVAAEVEKTVNRLELFWQEHLATIKNGCCIVTSDHGMKQIDPKKTWFLNSTLGHFEEIIKRNQKNELIVPCGSSRDFFLHIQEPYLEQAYNELTQALDGIASVHKTALLIEEGLFSKASIRLLARVGNLVLLPYGENSCWWYEPKRFGNTYHGHHGGLTKEELHTIFLFQRIESIS